MRDGCSSHEEKGSTYSRQRQIPAEKSREEKVCSVFRERACNVAEVQGRKEGGVQMKANWAGLPVPP